MAFGQLEQDGCGLGQALAILFEHGDLTHLVDPGAPFGRARDAAAEVRPDRLEGLAAQGQHERQLVAVARLGEVMEAIAR